MRATIARTAGSHTGHAAMEGQWVLRYCIAVRSTAPKRRR